MSKVHLFIIEGGSFSYVLFVLLIDTIFHFELSKLEASLKCVDNTKVINTAKKCGDLLPSTNIIKQLLN